MKLRNKKGFTIVELVIVIAVIAILAAVLIPTFAGLVEKANRSVDMQLVKSMNDILITEEVTGNKPVTVVDAKKILSDNGISQFKPVASNNVFYWVGTDNRVLLWEKDEEAATGKVTYPEDSKKKYETYTQPSADWSNLSEEQRITNITPAEGEDVKTALLTALQNAEDGAILRLPANQVIDMGGEGTKLGEALNNDHCNSLTVDLNGCTLDNAVNSTSIKVPDNKTLAITNGTINGTAGGEGTAAFPVGAWARLVLRDVKMDLSNSAGVFPSENASEVVIDNCVITVTNYVVGTNKLSSNAIRVSISNSTLTATGATSLMMNVESITSITNCTITGVEHAIAARAGSFTIENSTLNTTSTDPDIYSYKNFASGYGDNLYWLSGNAIPAAVITAGEYLAKNTYPGDVTFNLKNVKLNSADASKVPTLLVSAYDSTGTKKVTVTYDGQSSVGNVVIYGADLDLKGSNASLPDNKKTVTHDGTITVNGKAVTLESGTTKIAD